MATGEEIRKFWAQTRAALSEVDIASAIIDEVHPLRTVLPVFEKIGSLKSIVVYPDLEHEYRTDFTNHAKAWMDRYLR